LREKRKGEEGNREEGIGEEGEMKRGIREKRKGEEGNREEGNGRSEGEMKRVEGKEERRGRE